MIEVPRFGVCDEVGWDDADAVFAGAPELPMRQAWRGEPESALAAGGVSLGWNDAGLWVWARFRDEVVLTSAEEDQQFLWMLGDTFEIFVQPGGGEEYWEFHAAPNGRRLTLRFATLAEAAAVRSGGRDISQQIWPEADFRASARTVAGGWEVLAAFGPVSATFRAAFCRYDYSSPGGPPVLSSTAPFPVLDFHRPGDWAAFALAS